jgi:hypothetical protein
MYFFCHAPDGDIEMGSVDHGKAKAPDVPRITEADGEGESVGSFRGPDDKKQFKSRF